MLCVPSTLAKPYKPFKFGHTGGHFKKEHSIEKIDPCVPLDINVGLALDTSGSIGGNEDGGQYQDMTDAVRLRHVVLVVQGPGDSDVTLRAL